MGRSEYFRTCWATGIFLHRHFLTFTGNGPEKRINPVSRSCVGQNTVLMLEVRAKWVGVVRYRRATVTQITICYNQGIVMCGGYFLGTLCTSWASFQRCSLPEYCCRPVHPFMTALYPSSGSYAQQDNAPCHKDHTVSHWFLEPDNEFTVL